MPFRLLKIWKYFCCECAPLSSALTVLLRVWDRAKPTPTTNSTLSGHLGEYWLLFLTTARLQMNKTKFQAPECVLASVWVTGNWPPVFSHFYAKTPIIFPIFCAAYSCSPLACGRSLDFSGKLRAVATAETTLSSKPAVHLVKEQTEWRSAFVHDWKDDTDFFLVMPIPEAWIRNPAMITEWSSNSINIMSFLELGRYQLSLEIKH